MDDDEVRRRDAWQMQLKRRIDQASDIIAGYCSIRFKVREFGTWNSDNRVRDLNRSLREFEQEVSPRPAQIAIGFTSQYKFQKGRNALGGTRGPLHSHVLLRESSPSTFEPEKLEALVHELGHFLGAAHSSDVNSVMRPVVGDGRANGKTFRIGFDPANAKIIRLIGNEVTYLKVRKYADLSDTTKAKIMAEYIRLARELPKDPAAKRYIELLQLSGKRREVVKSPRSSLPNLPIAPLLNKKR